MNFQKITATSAVRFVKESAKLHNKPLDRFLAYMLISRTTWWRWRNKRTKPDYDVLCRIQNANERLKARSR